MTILTHTRLRTHLDALRLKAEADEPLRLSDQVSLHLQDLLDAEINTVTRLYRENEALRTQIAERLYKLDDYIRRNVQ